MKPEILNNYKDEFVTVLPENNVDCGINVQTCDNVSVAGLRVHNAKFGQNEVCRMSSHIVNSEANMSRLNILFEGNMNIDEGKKQNEILTPVKRKFH